nr:transposase [Frankia sp. Cj5]
MYRIAETIAGEPAAAGAQGAAAVLDEELARRLVTQAKADGVSLSGPGGMLGKLTKMVLETTLEAERTAHLGYEAHDPAGRDGGDSRNGTRTKTVVTEIGLLQVDVPRDRDASVAPRIVAKRHGAWTGSPTSVVSLVAKGLTAGEVQAHLAEIYGTGLSRQTISNITNKVIEGIEAWDARPLDAVYAVVFIDAIVVKIRDGQVAIPRPNGAGNSRSAAACSSACATGRTTCSASSSILTCGRRTTSRSVIFGRSRPSRRSADGSPPRPRPPAASRSRVTSPPPASTVCPRCTPSGSRSAALPGCHRPPSSPPDGHSTDPVTYSKIFKLGEFLRVGRRVIRCPS